MHHVSLLCSQVAMGSTDTTRAACGAVDVVVKIGGSACTIKSSFETLNEPALHAVCDQLAAATQAGRSVAIVHGAGSFGHKQAREYGISKGADGNGGGGAGLLPGNKAEGFAKTRLSVTTLNKHVVTALIDRGVPAVTISPFPFIGTVGKKLKDGLSSGTVDAVQAMLDRGLVPVVHGDAVLDDAQGCAILSGDIWMVEMPRTLKARRAVFVTDVDGVFTKPPTEEGAQLIPEILVDPESGEFSLPGVEMSCDTKHDVTGGLKEKLRCAADVLKEAPSVEAVYIVRAGSEAAAQAIRGDTPVGATVLKRGR
eukprot:TRINITY_DN3432_c0_g2_i1.p1 TRINITY_DN3432_c0_g2~~TRINITY_DN3432_c0_g2_i1.p1  ORF type:complete len:311 (-),score=73.54 TRINITY_DN3432_c0_g2_i1:385-1317(-)